MNLPTACTDCILSHGIFIYCMLDYSGNLWFLIADKKMFLWVISRYFLYSTYFIEYAFWLF